MTVSVDTLVPVNGGHVFCRTWAQAASHLSPIVLLHDSLGSVDLWGSFPIELAEVTGRSVIAYDRLGFGRSSARIELPSLDFIREEAEVYFPDVKQSLGIQSFCLFGHSVGGGMAIAIASRFPKECVAVVTESAQAFVEDLTIAGIQSAKEKFKDTSAFGKLEKLHGEKAKWVLSAWMEVWLSPSFADWNLRNELKRVLCPMLIIHGDRDDYGSRAFPDMMHALAGGESQLELIADCGHVPHREKSDLILSLATSFLVAISQ